MLHYNFKINGFEFGGREQLARYFRNEIDYIFTLKLVTGFSGVAVQHSERNAYGQHGIVDYNSFFRKRIMKFTGELHAKNPEALKRAIDEISAKITLPSSYTPEDDGYSRFEFWDNENNGDVFWTNVKMNETPMFGRALNEKTKLELSFSLKSEDPFFYSVEETKYGLKRTYFDCGVKLPLSPEIYGTALPLKFSPKSIFRKLVYNGGNYAAKPKIKIIAPVKNPIISHVELGIFMKLNIELKDDEFIEIDTKSREIINQDGENMRRSFDRNSRWLFLTAGENHLDFTDDLPTAPETLVVPEEQIEISFHNSSIAKS